MTDFERALLDYVKHRRDCAKWGPIWAYPRRLHHDIGCTCGLSAALEGKVRDTDGRFTEGR